MLFVHSVPSCVCVRVCVCFPQYTDVQHTDYIVIYIVHKHWAVVAIVWTIFFPEKCYLKIIQHIEISMNKNKLNCTKTVCLPVFKGRNDQQ